MSISHMFKDGEEPGDSIWNGIAIEVVSNGWLVTYTDEEEHVIQEVYGYADGIKMLGQISNNLGIVNERNKPSK